MKIPVENYKKFIDIVTALSPMLNDIQIKNAKICQVDKARCNVIMGDLSSIFPDFDVDSVYLHTLDKKLPMFKMFKDSDSDIEIGLSEDGRRYFVSDSKTSFTAGVPGEITMYKDSYFQPLHDENHLITAFTLDKKLLKRAVTGMKTMDSDVFTISFDMESNSGSLSIFNTAGKFDLIKDLTCYEFVKKCTLEMTMLKKSVGDLVDVKIYRSIDNSSIYVIRCFTELEGCPFEYRQRFQCAF